MAQQYNDAIEALEDNPQLRKKFEKERKNFLREIAEAGKNQPTKSTRPLQDVIRKIPK